MPLTPKCACTTTCFRRGRRGFTAAAIRDFCERIGVAKANSTVDLALLEFCLREELNKTTPRVMAVLRPLKVVLTNYPEGQVEYLEADNHPGIVPPTRSVPSSSRITARSTTGASTRSACTIRGSTSSRAST